MEDAGHLAADIAAAHDHQAAWQLGQVEHLVRDDHVLATRQIGVYRRAARGHQDMGRRQAAHIGAIGGHHHGVGVGEPALADNALHLGIAHQAFVDAVEAGDFLRARCFERLPVQRNCLGHLPAVATCLGKGLGIASRIAVELFGNAAHVDTGAAHGLGLHHRHLGPPCCRHAGGPHAARSATNHHQIQVPGMACLHALRSFVCYALHCAKTRAAAPACGYRQMA